MKITSMFMLLFVWCVQFSYAQEKTITGTVTDQVGLPLPGVNVVVKGTNRGVQSDFDGEYTIKANQGEVLVYTYLGQRKEERAVGSSTIINLQMVEDTKVLEEVVVTALGISRDKKSLGYSTQVVTGESLSETRNSNALNSLSGRVAGIQISTPSGNLGGSSRILIRGAGSITQNNRPLIVVDGIPLNNSNYNSSSTQTGSGGRDYGDASFDINPDDVESMNILKGGPAAALYGSRAQNGVILITTKSGKIGRTEIQVNSGISFDQISIIPKVQKLYGGGGGVAETIEQSGFQQVDINGRLYDIVDYGTDESWGPRYNPDRLVLHWDAFDPEFPEDYLNPRPWIYPNNDSKEFFNVGITYNNGIAFSQANDKTDFRVSFNNTKTQGIVPNSELKRTSINLNGSTQLTDRLKIQTGVNFTITDGFNRPEFGYGGNSVILQFFQFGQTSLDYDRLKKYQLPNGVQRTWNRIAYNDSKPRYADNPYWTVNQNTANDKRTRLYGNIGVTYNLTDAIYTSFKVYGDTYNLRINQRVAIGSQAQSSYSESDRNFQELNYEGRVHYDGSLADIWTVNAFVGANRRDVEFHSFSGNTRGGLAANGIYNLNNSTDDPALNDFDSQQRVNSLFGSVSLGYKSLAYVTITGRNDWSSTLPVNNNSYFYPSVNASIVFSQLLSTPWLSFGKLRGGYAIVGNDTAPYNLINTYGSGSSFFESIRFSQLSSNLNPDLRNEEKNTWEIGLEMAFFNNRLSFDLTYYDELTKDLITPVQIDPSTGFTTTVENAGKLSNKGIEVLVNVTPVKLRNFSWDFTWNFAKNNNELLELLPGVSTLQLATFPFNGVSLNAVVGEPYGIIRGTNYVFDDQGNKVIGEDGRYLETQNVENLGSVIPDYNMGFRNSISYKNFDLSVLIDVQKGGKYRSLTNLWGNYSGILEQTAANNIREEGIVLDGVTGTVTYDDRGNYTVTNTSRNTTVISAQQFGQDYRFRADAQNIFDADYIKLREITLGYTLPVKWIGPLSSVRLNAFGRNLFIFGLDNKNFDPEVATGGSGNIQGSEGGSLPSTRTYGLNVQLKF